MRVDDRADALSRYFEPRVYQRNCGHYSDFSETTRVSSQIFTRSSRGVLLTPATPDSRNSRRPPLLPSKLLTRSLGTLLPIFVEQIKIVLISEH